MKAGNEFKIGDVTHRGVITNVDNHWVFKKNIYEVNGKWYFANELTLIIPESKEEVVKLMIEIKTLVTPSSKAHFDTMNFFDAIGHKYTSTPIYPPTPSTDNIEQILNETMADFLDSKAVQFEELNNGLKDPVPRDQSELHIRMAKAAFQEYKNTIKKYENRYTSDR